MRRVVLTVIALTVFLPSMALSRTQFLCATDLLVREACCCPPKPAKVRVVADAPTMQRECCKLVKHTPVTPPVASESSPVAPFAPVAVVVAAAPRLAPIRDTRLAIAPRAQAPPPRSLLSQHCALLV